MTVLRTLIAFSLSSMLIVGCQTSIVVKVELLRVAGDRAPLHPTTAALKEAQAYLEVCAQLDNFSLRVVHAGPEVELQDIRAARMSYVAFDELGRRALELLPRAAELLTENARVLSTPGGADPLAFRKHVESVEAFMSSTVEIASKAQSLKPTLDGVLSGIQDDSGSVRIEISIPDRVNATYVTSGTQNANLKSLAIRYGGFAVSGVFLINGGDPRYGEVVSAKPAGTFGKATVEASGDTTAVIVFDDPIRVRTFQMSNDPRQLIRNVLMVIDKALQAVAKYASIGA